MPTACSLTGVKHLHHKAQAFDIGIYFEANGHGTVLFSDRAIETFQMASEDECLSEVDRNAARQLLALTQLINQAVGDAISDLLLVECILLLRGVSEVREVDEIGCNEMQPYRCVNFSQHKITLCCGHHFLG